ncbi:MAG: AAA family ATPase [Candidatus Aminicenantes bacterium]|nr:MAG: AAA family ATPase [Candidatus Aminicenantes bacterium]
MNKMTNSSIKKIPYGIADYDKIVTDNCYYVDKTAYLRILEQTGDYLFFIRPRRFGKSLFLSVMEAYYDIFYKEKFETYFKDTVIYQKPTPNRGDYLVLKFNFSMVDPAVDRVEASFLSHIRGRALSFIRKYSNYLIKDLEYFKKSIEESWSAPDILSIIRDLCKDSHQKSYAIIDEYDNFANSILSTAGEKAYQDLTRGEGFFRSFFNVLKGGTDGMEAPFTRLFLTGVSPVTMDDVTSGFNIGKNVSIDDIFNQLLGFTNEDVIKMIEYYRQFGLIKHDNQYLLDIMSQWYDNYIFSTKSTTKLFNPDMVLYFLDEYFKSFQIPEDLIDRNVRIDYQKLRHLIIIERKGKKEENGNFSRLREILEMGETVKKLKKGFPLEEVDEPENFISLLFYLGLLTIKGRREGLTVFKIPNQTVKTLYYDYIIRVSKEIGLLDVNVGKVEDLLHDMAYHGNWNDFFAYLSQRMAQSTAIRDYIREEKVIQGFLLAYLGISDYFIVHSEKELNKGYADIVMEPFFAVYAGIKYSYMIEIKYIAKEKGRGQKTLGKKMQKLKAEAEEQLKKYSLDENFKKIIGKTTLIKLVLIFYGSQLKYIDEASD